MKAPEKLGYYWIKFVDDDHADVDWEVCLWNGEFWFRCMEGDLTSEVGMRHIAVLGPYIPEPSAIKPEGEPDGREDRPSH